MSRLALARRARHGTVRLADATDEELVAAVRAGDDTAFERLFQRHHAPVTGYVARMLGSREPAEEVVQEAFISALRRLRETEGAMTFKAWIYGIARNAAIDHLRARSRRGTHVGIEHAEAALETSGRAAVSTPEAVAAGRQALSDLRGAFGALTALHHRILVLRELEGLSYDEIGARLDLSRPQVESTLFRARRRLGEEYSELASGERCRHVQAMLATGDVRRGLRDAHRVERHVAHCSRCRREAARLRRTAPAVA